MQINRVSLIVIPFITMLLASYCYSGSISGGTTIAFNSSNVTVNQKTGDFQVSPITLENILLITVLIAVGIAVVLVLGIQILGSGVSGSVIPIVFLVIILTGLYAVLSVLSWNIFTQIPIFGLPIYFFLLVLYIIGIASLGAGTGGD